MPGDSCFDNMKQFVAIKQLGLEQSLHTGRKISAFWRSERLVLRVVEVAFSGNLSGRHKWLMSGISRSPSENNQKCENKFRKTFVLSFFLNIYSCSIFIVEYNYLFFLQFQNIKILHPKVTKYYQIMLIDTSNYSESLLFCFQ